MEKRCATKKKIVNVRRVKVSLTPVHRSVRRLVGPSTTTFCFDLLGATYAVQADCFTPSLPSENVTKPNEKERLSFRPDWYQFLPMTCPFHILPQNPSS